MGGFSLSLPCHMRHKAQTMPSTWLACGQPIEWIPFSGVFFQWTAVIVEEARGLKNRCAALCSPVQPHFDEPA